MSRLSTIDRKTRQSGWRPVYPELYLDLRRQAGELLSSKVAEATKIPDKESVREKIRVHEVKREPSLRDKPCIASDASSNRLPLAISRIALIGAIALRHPGNFSPSVSGGVVDLPANYSDTDFLVHLSAKRESLIPDAILHQLGAYGKPAFALCDGPLSVSQWYNLASSKQVKDSVRGLLLSRSRLIDATNKDDITLFGVVKRSISQHFQAKLGWQTEFSDQFLLHQALEYGERTEDISISDVLRESMVEVSGQPLTEQLTDEIFAFYIKTSRNILSPPLRIEIAGHARSKIDQIATYVLSSAIESNDMKYDGLPQAQCFAHRDGKVTSDAMSAIMREQLAKFSLNSTQLRLLSLYSTQGGS